jgi:ATP-dependent Lon protease
MKSQDEDKNQAIVNIGHFEIDTTRFDAEPDVNDLPILATRNLVLFPSVTIPIALGRPNSITTARLASERAIPIGIVCQLDPNEEKPAVTTGLFKYGVVADVLNVFDLPDGTQTALVRARCSFRIMGKGAHKNLPEAELTARIRTYGEILPKKDDVEFKVLADQIRKSACNIVKSTTENSKEFIAAIQNIENPVEMIHFVATNLPIDTEAKFSLLTTSIVSERALALLTELNSSEEKVDISRDIMNRTRKNMDQNQRNAFLQQQMDTIREELYGDSQDEIRALADRAFSTKFPLDVSATFDKELEKLRRLNPSSPDYSVQYSYLETLLDLPWAQDSEVNTDFESASNILEHDHYGLDKVKERIIEQMAVLMNTPRGKSPIICLVGPPGVGKTSLGKSVANALGRKYVRVSFGGLHDEAEIRGHRRTYIGAMPGRIIDAMRRAGTSNPVLLLDEIDKIGSDFKGDPAAALLEVLDPEQNSHFHDNYIDVDYDLSHVLFIATANTLSTIARPLLDRMEIIELSGYLLEEKVAIARRHLIVNIMKEHKLEREDLHISKEALVKIIENYTSESGVRQLEKRLSAIARKAVVARMRKTAPLGEVLPEHLKDLLGLPTSSKDAYEGNDYAGVVTGLAWTQVGGEILLAEASLSAGKGEKVTITGNLGDVMKESAAIALQWVKANATELGIDSELFSKYNLHIHFPEGAIPKDGPSAGITIATAIVSAFTQKRVAPKLAMTGEITLRGRVLPVGGIKEKILAAKRAGINTIVLSEQNRKDIEDIPAIYVEGLTFHYVERVMDVIKIAITDQPAVDAKIL